MSRGDALNDALAAYTGSLFAPEDALLRDLARETRNRGFPPIQVPALTGRVLQLLLQIVQARRVLEIGTRGGYSAIWMARALPPDGKLVTLELNEAHATLAREFFRRAHLADRVELWLGPAADTLARLVREGAAGPRGAEGAVDPFDACFIDADKENYPAYLRWARRLVRVGGLILADNAYQSGRILEDPPSSEQIRAMRQFNRMLAHDPGLESTILPVGDGVAVAFVTAAPARKHGES